MVGEERQVVISDPITPKVILARSERVCMLHCARVFVCVSAVSMTLTDPAGLSLNLESYLKQKIESEVCSTNAKFGIWNTRKVAII